MEKYVEHDVIACDRKEILELTLSKSSLPLVHVQSTIVETSKKSRRRSRLLPDKPKLYRCRDIYWFEVERRRSGGCSRQFRCHARELETEFAGRKREVTDKNEEVDELLFRAHNLQQL
jgi:hypothetical protein